MISNLFLGLLKKCFLISFCSRFLTLGFGFLLTMPPPNSILLRSNPPFFGAKVGYFGIGIFLFTANYSFLMPDVILEPVTLVFLLMMALSTFICICFFFLSIWYLICKSYCICCKTILVI